MPSRGDYGLVIAIIDSIRSIFTRISVLDHTLSRTVTPAESLTLFSILVERFRIPADQSAKDPARLFYEPACPPDASPFVKVGKGREVNVDEFLGSAGPAPLGTPRKVMTDACEVGPASPEVLGDARSALKRLGPAIQGQGGDQHTFQACAILANDYALTKDEARPLALEWNETCQPRWEEDELLLKLANGQSYAQGEFGAKRRKLDSRRHFMNHLAARRQQDQISAPEGTKEREYQEAVAQAERDIETRSGTSRVGASKPRLRPLSQLLTEKQVKTLWRVDGLLPVQSVAVIAGEPKTAKTWAVAELALSVATGTTAFGEFCTSEARAVAMFLLEDSELSVRTRFSALAVGRGLDPVIASKLIHVECRGTLDLLNKRHVAEIIASARLAKAALITIDPFRDGHSADENDSTAMAGVMAAVRMIRDLAGCVVVFVHHVSKSSKETVGRRPGQRMRGSTVVHGGIDAGVYMTLKESTPTRWVSIVESEVKSAKCAGTFGLTLEVEDNDSGEAVKATWRFEREATNGGATRTAECEAEVLQALKDAWEANPTEPKPLGVKVLANGMSTRKEAVTAALRRLRLSGRAKEVGSGFKKLGHVYVPTEGETP